MLLRCVGAWSKAKHYYLEKYVNTFTTSMRKKWDGQLYYVDLFAGPGKSLARETEEEIDGSPLIALNAPYAFAGYFFVDSNREVLDVLSERCKSHPNFGRINFCLGDCNSVINDVIKDIPKRSLSLAFIDPTGLQFKFATLQKLAQRKVDLIITFPDGMAIKRNIKKFLEEPHSPLDDMVGDRQWRKFQTAKGIVGYYRNKLPTLGYQEVRLGDEVRIRSFSRKLPLYLLLFASKNLLGHKFWQEISKINHTGQRKFDFNGFSNLTF